MKKSILTVTKEKTPHTKEHEGKQTKNYEFFLSVFYRIMVYKSFKLVMERDYSL